MNRFTKKLLSFVLATFYADGDGTGGTTASAALTAPPTGAQPGGAASSAGTPSPEGQQPSAGAPTWYDTMKDQEVKDWIKAQNNGIPDVEALGRKALNLEKFVGAEKAGRGVVLPKPDAPAAEWKAFYEKTGTVPPKPEAYSLPKDLDPKMAEEFSKDPLFAKFQAYAHSVGMPQQHFGETIKWFMNESKSMLEGKDADFERKIEADLHTLKTEWGKEWDKNVELGRRATQAFVPHKDATELQDVMNRIEGAIGTAATFRLFAKIGEGLGEHAFVSGGGVGGGGMTPEAARIRIQELKKDPAWGASFAAGDAEKKAEWTRLHKIGYPDVPKGA